MPRADAPKAPPPLVTQWTARPAESARIARVWSKTYGVTKAEALAVFQKRLTADPKNENAQRAVKTLSAKP
ncbi:hypothetical protein [Corallococcus sp. 4LFB]|uniref:hypothetical protein n=1 Tax=Corallococcus sp. 4LFB TaxID=3383249 RepID=UPI0039764258